MDEIERQRMLRANEAEMERIIINRAELPCQNCATLTAERDAAEESRRFYIAERDRLREALGYAYHRLHGYAGHDRRTNWRDCDAGDCPTNRDTWALAGTGETP